MVLAGRATRCGRDGRTGEVFEHRLTPDHAKSWNGSGPCPVSRMKSPRDPVHAREGCRGDLMSVRQQLSKLLLRQGIVYYDGQRNAAASERQVDVTVRGVSLVVIRRVLPEHIRRLRQLWPIRNVRIRAIGHLRIRIGTGDGRKDDCGTDRRRDQPGSVLDRCSHGWFCPSDDFVCPPPTWRFCRPKSSALAPVPTCG